MKSKPHKIRRQKPSALARAEGDGQLSVPKPEKIERLLNSACIFADDPDFVRIMNEVYSETRGRVIFDE